MSRENISKSQTFNLLRKERVTFLHDALSIFDFSPIEKKFKYSRTDEEADFRAIESDWKAVGADIKNSLKKAHV